jgi:hypothetical protein
MLRNSRKIGYFVKVTDGEAQGISMDADYRWTLIGGAVLIAICLVVFRINRGRRSKEFKEAASRLKMRYSPEDDSFRRELFFTYPLFQRGHPDKCTASNFLRGERNGMDVVLFDYRYTTQHKIGQGFELKPSGVIKDYSTYAQSVAAIRLQSKVLPQFEMCPETLLHKIGALAGMRDIDFESHSEFSKRYRLRGKSERAVREAFTFEVLGYFDRSPGWSLEANGEWLLCYRHDRQVSPDELDAFLEEALHIARLF